MNSKIVLKPLDLRKIKPAGTTPEDLQSGGSKIVVLGKPGTGKCLARDTPVITESGSIVSVQNVRVGDMLMGDDFKPRRVASTCFGVAEKMYKIRQSHGLEYTVNPDHIISVINEEGEIEDVIVEKFYEKYFKNENAKPYYIPMGVKVLPDRAVGPYACYEDRLQTIISAILRGKPNESNGEFNYHYNTKQNYFSVYCDGDADLRTLFITAISIGADVEMGDPKKWEARFFGIRSPTVNYEETREYVESSLRKCVGTQSTVKYNQYLTKVITTKLLVEELPGDDYFGFELDPNGPNQRFLLGDFTVTHNSSLIKSLIYEKSHIFPVGIFYSGTEQMNHFYGNFAPDTFIFNEFSMDQFGKSMARQKLARRELGDKNPWSLKVIDDCNNDPNIFKRPNNHNKPISTLMKNGRHYCNLTIIAQQYAMDIDPSVRAGFDGVFILQEAFKKNRKKLFENYVTCIESFDVFCDLLDSLPEYTALYFDNRANAVDISKCVSYYTPVRVPEDWKFGCDDYWKFHEERYDTEYEDEDELGIF